MPLEFGAAKLFGVTSGYSADVLAVGRIFLLKQMNVCSGVVSGEWRCYKHM